MTNSEQIKSSFGYVLLSASLLLVHCLARIGNTNFERSGTPVVNACNIEIRGMVTWPGVYGFAQPPLLLDLIKVAGGLTTDLRIEKLSTKDPIPCFKSVSVYQESSSLRIRIDDMDPFHKIALGMKLNLNRETAQGLTAIPGIGMKTARAIIAFRNKIGMFDSLEEVGQVPGIGAKSMERIRNYASLNTCFTRRSCYSSSNASVVKIKTSAGKD